MGRWVVSAHLPSGRDVNHWTSAASLPPGSDVASSLVHRAPGRALVAFVSTLSQLALDPHLRAMGGGRSLF
eukprot:7868281-Heterocapsa_arctica.AAC.1